jgi:DNA-binding transcriptional MerR regulator
MDAQPLRIGQVARSTGLTVDTIRFYEKSGLLPRPARTEGGYRLYQQREVADLEFIQKAQQLGFSLHEIRELLSIQRHPQEACTHVQELIVQKLAVVRGKIDELRHVESGLATALEQCRKALRRSANHSSPCPVLREISAAPPERKRA